jgi:hypothetical protein
MCSRRRTTCWSGTSGIRPIRTRCSRVDANVCRPSSSLGDWRRSRPAAKASTTPSVSATRVRPLVPPSGWPLLPPKLARTGESWPIIGDGALTAGMAFEALNHAGSLPTNLLVISERQQHVNFRERGCTIEATSRSALSGRRVRASAPGRKENAATDAQPCSAAGATLGRALEGNGAARERCLKRWAFNYIGPVDGHDVKALVAECCAICASFEDRSYCTC